MRPIREIMQKVFDETCAVMGGLALAEGAFLMYTGEWWLGAVPILVGLAFFCGGMYGILERRRRHREQKRAAAKDRNGG